MSKKVIVSIVTVIVAAAIGFGESLPQLPRRGSTYLYNINTKGDLI